MSMSDLISQHYAPSDVDLEKQAQIELFAKLADANGIDLDQLSQDQISYLWDETFNKTASDNDEDEEEKKIEAAKKEHEAKKEAAAKVAEAVYLGEVMANSMTAQLQKNAGVKATFNTAVAHGKRALKSGGEHLDRVGKKVMMIGADDDVKALAKQTAGIKGQRAAGAAVYGTGLTAAGGATVVGKKLYDRSQEKGKHKKSSALDDLAGEQAVIKAAEAGWDPEEAGQRVGALLTLGVDESEKVASAQDLETAVDVRSLELLELAGYPVTWPG